MLILAKWLAREIKKDTSNSLDILTLSEINLDSSIYSGNFSVTVYLFLIRNDYITYMHALAVYVKEGLPFAGDLSQKTSAESYLCLLTALPHSMSYFFFLYQSPSSLLCTVFDSFSFNIDEVLSINPTANVFSVESQMTLLRWLTFLLRSRTVTLTVLLFCIYIFISCSFFWY